MLVHHAQTREELVLVATAVCTHPAIGRTTPLTALRTDEPLPEIFEARTIRTVASRSASSELALTGRVPARESESAAWLVHV
jgi:hypothetical protein